MRPTLEEQIRVSKLTDEELLRLLAPPHNLELWMYGHCKLLWRIVSWNWYNCMTDTTSFRNWNK